MGKSTTKDSKKAKTSEVLSKVKSGGITKPSKTSKSSSKELAKAAAQKLEKSKSKKKKVVEPESSSESESSESESESEASSSESESSEDEKVTKKPVTNGKPKAKAAASSDSESESESESDSGSDSDSDSESEEETKVKAPAPKVNGTAKKVAAESSDSDSDSAESDSDSDSDESEDEKPAAKVEAVKKAAESDDSDDSDDSEEDSDDSDDSDDSESDDAEEKKAEAPSKKRKAEEEIDEAPKKAKSEGQAATTLFVGSLSWGIDDDALYEAFKSFEPANARVVTDKNDGRSRGFGYVDFNDAESATKAYEAMQGQELEGRALNLDYANARTTEANPQNRAADRAKKHGDTISPESDTLFVGNLPFDVDQDIVREFFGEVAEVASVRLPTDPDSGNLKGFGYVTFNSIEDAKAVLDAKNGAPIGTGRMSRSVRLDFAGQRPQREGGGGFGGGFGGGRGGGRGGRGGGRGRGGDRGRGGGRGRGGFGGRGGFSTGANRTSFSGTKMTFD